MGGASMLNARCLRDSANKETIAAVFDAGCVTMRCDMYT